MELNEKIKAALIKMDFVRKYEELSNRFDEDRTPFDDMLRNADRDLVKDIIRKLGHETTYNRREKFFKIQEEKIGNFTFGFLMDVSHGDVDFIWHVWEGEKVILGSPWGVYSRLLIDVNYRIFRPVFGTYEDLEEILKVGFTMYEEFKSALISM